MWKEANMAFQGTYYHLLGNAKGNRKEDRIVDPGQGF
jgi:hypothetical protein